jgi:hypothetical protein
MARAINVRMARAERSHWCYIEGDRGTTAGLRELVIGKLDDGKQQERMSSTGIEREEGSESGMMS